MFQSLSQLRDLRDLLIPRVYEAVAVEKQQLINIDKFIFTSISLNQLDTFDRQQPINFITILWVHKCEYRVAYLLFKVFRQIAAPFFALLDMLNLKFEAKVSRKEKLN